MKNYTKLKKRIKKNEGYSESAYQDLLGFFTIGYGHLIKSKEKYFLKGSFTKNILEKLFENDFSKAVNNYNKYYKKERHSSHTEEVLIEMIFQLGIKGQQKFVKMNKHIQIKNFYMASLEMKSSVWYSQTPNRVIGLIEILLKNINDR